MVFGDSDREYEKSGQKVYEKEVYCLEYACMLYYFIKCSAKCKVKFETLNQSNETRYRLDEENGKLIEMMPKTTLMLQNTLTPQISSY